MSPNEEILDEESYDQALERIELLMDKPLHRNELRALVRAVEKYEDVHWPIRRALGLQP